MFVNQPFYPYFGVVAGNTDSIVNDIDIAAIYVKNLDESKYKDKEAINNLRLKYLHQK